MMAPGCQQEDERLFGVAIREADFDDESCKDSFRLSEDEQGEVLGLVREDVQQQHLTPE